MRNPLKMRLILRLTRLSKVAVQPGIICLSMMFGNSSFACSDVSFSESLSSCIGVAIRLEATWVEDEAANDSGDSFDVNVNSARITTHTSLLPGLEMDLNAEYVEDQGVGILDAFFNFKFSDALQFRGGRLIPPSDRSNLSGSFYIYNWSYPTVVAIFSPYSQRAGRDEGLAVWGQLAENKLTYQLGLFDGQRVILADSPKPSGERLFSARVAYNFWEPEVGYYTSSTYHGEKEVLAIGLTLQKQSDAAGSVSDNGDYRGVFADFLLEKPLSNGGVPSLEASYYDYDYDNKAAYGSRVEGEGYFALLAYLFPQGDGPGRWQPVIRYQEFTPNFDPQKERLDFGLNYIRSGHNMRFALEWSNIDDGFGNYQALTVGAQFQF